jgi:hypothetical protein
MHAATPDWPQQAGTWTRPIRNGLERSRDWLDARGKTGWIVAMVLGFILFWPIGLALLVYMIWSNRMSCNGWGRRAHRHDHRSASAPTGNAAFDAYRAETLKRLEDERAAFTAFLDQLRAAKDQAEFDQFMSSRRAPTPEAA